MNTREKFAEYFDKFVTLGFVPRLTLPTRFAKKTCSLIDQIYCKLANSDTHSSSAILVAKVSDHLPGIFSFDIAPKINKNPKYVTKKNFCEVNIEKFIIGVGETLINLDINKNLKANPNLTYNKIHETLDICHDKYFPTTTVRFNRYKHSMNPWITPGLMKSIKKRDKLYISLKKSKVDTPIYDTRKRNLTTYNTILKRTIKDNKKCYYFDQFKKYTGDCKKTWNTISTVLNRKNKKENLPQHFIYDQIKYKKGEEIEKIEITLTEKKPSPISLIYTLDK